MLMILLRFSRNCATREAIEARPQAAPFVAEDVVQAEILEVTPGPTDERLAFLAA